ncbi:MAG TPA: PQQ-binding-like beta-propeller repeat protein [Rhizomicrobium sp.]|jgi:outer membrane protein assembly factor BamB
MTAPKSGWKRSRTAAVMLGAAILSTLGLQGHAMAGKGADWLQYGNDSGQSGFYAHEKSVGKKTVSKLQLVASGGSAIQSPGLVLDRGVIYTASNDGTIYALNADDFSTIWSAPQLAASLFGDLTPAVAGKIVMTPCNGTVNNNHVTGLCGLKAATGASAWNTFCDDCSILNSPSVDDNLAFYQYNVEAGTAGTVYMAAVNTRNGKLAWQYAQPYHCPDNGLGSTQPIPVDNGRVYAPLGCQGAQQNENQICAFDETSGAQIWCTDYNDNYAEDVAANGTVYVTTGNGHVIAMDEGTGAVKWTATTVDWAFSRVATPDILYLGLVHDNGIVALSTKTGAQLWAVSGGFGGLTVANGIVYANVGGNNGHAIYALDGKTGEFLWQSNEGNGSSDAREILSGGTIYAACYTMCAYKIP